MGRRSVGTRTPTAVSSSTTSSSTTRPSSSATSPARAPSRLVLLQRQRDRQRQRLGGPRQVAGEGDGGAELAEGSRPAQRGACPQRRGDQRHGHPPEGRPAARAKGGGSVLVAPVHRPQARLGGDDQEGHGDRKSVV